jgi:hypothetical protein
MMKVASLHYGAPPGDVSSVNQNVEPINAKLENYVDNFLLFFFLESLHIA